MNSQLLESAVQAFASLPGIGKKSALRFALHIMKQPQERVDAFVHAISKFKSQLYLCTDCGYLSDAERCGICTNPRRDRSTICVVETVRDVMAVESTNHYYGLYHVLGGVISPIDGVEPKDLSIDDLVQRCEKSIEVEEVILALSPSIEGDSTCFYLANELKRLSHIKCSILSRGVSFGHHLEYTDEVTLGRAIMGRQPYNTTSGGL